jgi:hypothetical protein
MDSVNFRKDIFDYVQYQLHQRTTTQKLDGYDFFDNSMGQRTWTMVGD